MKPEIAKIYKVLVDAIIHPDCDPERLAQKYDDGIQEDFCVHGITYRWQCDDCEEVIQELKK